MASPVPCRLANMPPWSLVIKSLGKAVSTGAVWYMGTKTGFELEKHRLDNNIEMQETQVPYGWMAMTTLFIWSS